MTGSLDTVGGEKIAGRPTNAIGSRNLELPLGQGGAIPMLHRLLCVFAACSFTAVIAVAADKSASDAKDLQGTWQAVDL